MNYLLCQVRHTNTNQFQGYVEAFTGEQSKQKWDCPELVATWEEAMKQADQKAYDLLSTAAAPGCAWTRTATPNLMIEYLYAGLPVHKESKESNG